MRTPRPGDDITPMTDLDHIAATAATVAWLLDETATDVR